MTPNITDGSKMTSHTDDMPNTNIMLINEIEGLCDAIGEKWGQVKYDTPEQLRALFAARGKFLDWRNNELGRLKALL